MLELIDIPIVKKYYSEIEGISKMDRTKTHSLFAKKVMLHIQNEYKTIRLWETDCGTAYARHSVMAALKYALSTKDINGAIRKLITISYGKKGQGDITGIYFGRFISIEIKTGNAKQSKEQKNFEKMIKERNGIYITISDKYSIESQLKELNEMREVCSI